MHEAICVQTQETVHISQAVPNNQYLCIKCKCQVFVVRGNQKAHHFRHKAGAPKHGLMNSETEVHKFAKSYIADVRQIISPDGALLMFDRVELEEKVGSLRIDAVGYIGNKAYFIELCVHSAVSAAKLKKLRVMNVDVLEIHLLHWVINPRYVTGGKEFAKDVLFKAERKWLTRSGWEFWKRKITSWLLQLTSSKKPQLQYDDTTGQATFDF